MTRKLKNVSLYLNSKLDNLKYLTIFVLWVGLILNGCFLKLSSIISQNVYQFVDVFLFIAEGFIILLTLFLLFLKNKKKILLLYGGSLFLFGIFYICFPNNNEVILTIAKNFFVYNLTIFVMFYSLSFKNDLFLNLMKYIKLMFIFSCFYLGLLIIFKESLYNQWLSIHFFITSIFFLQDYLSTKKKTSLFLNFLSFIAVFITGSRICLLIYLLFLFYQLIVKIKRNYKKIFEKHKEQKISILIISCFLLFLVVINYKTIADSLFYFFYDKGLNIRILRLLATNNFFTSNERINIIYPNIIRLIKENWLFGLGIGGDRVAIYTIYENLNLLKPDSVINGYYSHNIFLEILSNFGIIIGGILIFFIIKFFYNAIKNNKVNRNVIISLLFTSIFPMLLIDSIWDNIYFWAFLGIIISSSLNKKKVDDHDR